MNSKDKRYFKVAKAVSETSNYGRIKIGSVIVQGKEIISVAANLRKSNPIQKQLNRYRDFDEYHEDTCQHFVHSEMNAILKAKDKDLHNAKIYIYREGKHGLAICRPCGACMKKIKEVGIKNIYYTTEDGFVHERLEY